MHESALPTDQKVGSNTEETIVKDVWTFMTSLKSLTKRSGVEEAFDPKKLAVSVEAAFNSAGQKHTRALCEKIVEQTIARLSKTYDGHTPFTSSDVREIVASILIDNNLTHVARKYFAFRHETIITRGDVFGIGINVARYFTKEGIDPFDEIEWEKRDARITNEKGETVFEQKEVEMPKFWSQTATNIVVSKYFQGRVGNDNRETSVRQLINRVTKTITEWGRKDGYFATAQDSEIFETELRHILVNQKAAFNSPVWFNVGVNPRPQCSACFINSVQDDMRSIMHLAATETMLFKGGSGTGTNLSTLRSSREFLSNSNNKSSGPVSFMRGLDAFAGVVKSGGKTRRAAKMVILNIDHPDIVDFIKCKVEEEKKAWALMDAGYDGSMDGSAYSSIYFQNANNSVRVTDDFMDAVVGDREWHTKEVTTGNNCEKHEARELMRQIAEAAWQCGDPGLQYDTTINRWHTCTESGRINASNPCSEYMFLDDSACNLASLNLMRFRKYNPETGEMDFDVESFKKANEIIITAMEILIGNSSYPTPAIEKNSFDYRPIGIGYANLGALLMSRGIAYDSDEGRNFAAAISSVQSGQCYWQSAKIAEKIGPFAFFKKNAESMIGVLRMHQAASQSMPNDGVPEELANEARLAWDRALHAAEISGVRNAQISVIAPTGTIAFLMDCDTTGIEPDLALVKYKWLVGGGMVKIVNNTVPEALVRLGYDKTQVEEILKYISENDTIEGAPHLTNQHLPIFDCAFKAQKGTRSIGYMGHLKMMAAVQPFISGAISKTVNMPNTATVEDVIDVYTFGWKAGLKAIAIYRDGSKRQQAMTTSKEKDTSLRVKQVAVTDNKPRRRRLSDERRSITHKFNIGNHEGYITVGLYDDGTPGEIFITMAKDGSVISGLMDAFATSLSIGLQYGVPLKVLVNKFVHTRFEPSGFTSNPRIRIAKSIVDYIFRWVAIRFLSEEEQMAVGINTVITESEAVEATEVNDGGALSAGVTESVKPHSAQAKLSLTSTFDNQSDAPACDTCGSIMVRNAACYKCLNCGGTSGCS